MKKKNLEFRFLFSLAAAFLEQSRRLEGRQCQRSVPVATSRTTVVRSRAWAVDGGLLGRLEGKLRDLGKDRAGMQCSKFQPSPRLGFDLALLLVLT